MTGASNADLLGHAWLGWITARMVVSALALTVVVLVLGLLRASRRGRSHGSAHLPSCLLLLPLVLLVLPIDRLLPAPATLQLPFASWVATAPESIAPAPALPESTAASNPTFGESDTPTGGASEPNDTARPRTEPVPVPWRTLLAAIWLAALSGLMVRLIYRQRAAIAGLERRSREPDAELAARFRLFVRESGIRRLVALRCVDGLESPLTSGVRRPIVWVPSDATRTMAGTELHFVLRHELAHVARHDVAIGAFIEVLRCAFWFFPGFWLAAALHARWREYACDEAALARSNVDRGALADSLLTLIERACNTPAPALSHAYLLSERTFMKTRLLRILDPRFRARPRLTAAAAPLLLLTLFGTVTLAQSEAPPRPGAAATTPAADAPVVVKNPTSRQREAVGTALTEGTRWLLQNQQADGGWVVGPDPAGKNVRDHNSTCVTAMAILALLPGLRTEPLPIAKAVQRAAAFLESQQQANGRIGPNDPMAAHYAHAFALRALAAVQLEWPTEQRQSRIELATDYCYYAQNPYSGWRYGVRDNDNDSKITSMMLLALGDASKCGIEPKERSITVAMLLLDQLTNPQNGRVGFVRRGGPMSRFVGKKADFPGELSEEPTALTLLARAAHDQSALEKDTNLRGLELVAALPPEWHTDKGSIDLAYWHFGAEAIALAAAAETPQIEPVTLERWRNALHEALVPNRITADGAAHWPAIDAWAHPGMEVYSTASAMLALQALR